jgi:ParB family chromosome partitioning protein
LEATRRARLTKIPAILAEGDAAEVALVENLIRQDLTCVEEAEAIEALKSRHNYTLAELSSILGKSVPTMSEIISLTRLPVSLRERCRGDHEIARSILVELAKLPDEQSMLVMFERYKNDGLTRTALRKVTAPAAKKPGSYTRLFRSFSRQVGKINISALQDTEKVKVKKELESLKKIIDDNLAKLHE